jgi:antirestriction protein ArdC
VCGRSATWIELLKADKRAFFTAGSKASKAADDHTLASELGQGQKEPGHLIKCAMPGLCRRRK